MRRIITDRLVLRPLTQDDAEDVFEWVTDPVVNRYMLYPLYHDIDEVRQWIEHASADPYEFGYELASEGKVIGSGSVRPVEDSEAYELGYNLNRNYWGRGFGTEAAKAMLRWAYDTHGAREFVAAHAIQNVASGNVIRKCGFEFEGYGQHEKFDGSETFDVALYHMHLD